jgi:hypothetical protein
MKGCARGTDPSDPGGRIGPANYDRPTEPDLRNLVLLYFPMEPGDAIACVSDGVHDNFDPVLLGEWVRELYKYRHRHRCRYRYICICYTTCTGLCTLQHPNGISALISAVPHLQQEENDPENKPWPLQQIDTMKESKAQVALSAVSATAALLWRI